MARSTSRRGDDKRLALPREGRELNEINRFASFLYEKWRIDTQGLFRLLANGSEAWPKLSNLRRTNALIGTRTDQCNRFQAYIVSPFDPDSINRLPSPVLQDIGS